MYWRFVYTLFLTFLFCECTTHNSDVCPNASCADYLTQNQAQAAFDADHDCMGELDSDSDGIACEHLINTGGGSGCPTTSNCGCSGKNKNECGGPCCKWIVGTGCRCN